MKMQLVVFVFYGSNWCPSRTMDQAYLHSYISVLHIKHWSHAFLFVVVHALALPQLPFPFMCPISFRPKPQASGSGGLDPDFTGITISMGGYSQMMYWVSVFCLFIISCCGARCLAASLVVRFSAPYYLVFPPEYSWSAHGTFFGCSGSSSLSFTTFLTHVCWACSQVCLSKFRLLPRPCVKVLKSVCFWSQCPVAHLFSWLWLFIPACFSSTPTPIPPSLTLNLELGLCETQVVFHIQFPTFSSLQIIFESVSYRCIGWKNIHLLN